MTRTKIKTIRPQSKTSVCQIAWPNKPASMPYCQNVHASVSLWPWVWPLILESFSAIPTNMANIYGKQCCRMRLVLLRGQYQTNKIQSWSWSCSTGLALGLVSYDLGVEKSQGAFRWQLRTTPYRMTTNIHVSSDSRASAGDLHQCLSALLIALVISKATT